MNQGDRIKNIIEDMELCVSAMTEATGKTADELFGRRTYPLPFYRGMIAKTLKEMGYTSVDIGAQFKKDHATILHNISQVNMALSTAGYGDIRIIWQDYQSILLQKYPQMRIQDKPSAMRQSAEAYVGFHCRKRCDCCKVKQNECTFLNQEATFLAGGEAYKMLLKDAIDELQSAIAECSVLCGRQEVQSALGRIDELL